MFQVPGEAMFRAEVREIEDINSAFAKITQGFHAIGIGAVTDHDAILHTFTIFAFSFPDH